MTLNPAPERLSLPSLRISAVVAAPPELDEHPAADGNRVDLESFCPYRGLKPFEEEDRPFFVGREDDARIIIANLYTSPLTVLYGASGVGKTSVLQAGVLPLLRETGPERPAVVLFRAWQTEDFAAALYDEVRRAVAAAGGNDAGVPADLPFDEYLEACAATLSAPVLLIFDQFEEYFMYNPPGPASARFEAELARTVNRRLSNARFLFCMREEGLSSLDRFARRIPNVMGNLLRLEPLDQERARRAIAEPLETYNDLRAGRNLPGMEIDPALVDQLLSQDITFEQARRGSPGAVKATRERAVQLPFLQLVLARLWSEERSGGSRVLRAETLTRMGGANAVVRSHLDEALHRLTTRQRRVAARTFWYLVTPSLTKIAHTPTDLAKMTAFRRREVEGVLRRLALSDARVLRQIDPVPGADGEQRYEITHDALAPAILHWREQHERTQRDWRAGLLAFGALVGLLAVFLVFREWATRERSAEDRRVKSEVGLTIARLLLPSDPGASHDTARQALQLHWTPAGRELAQRAAFDDRLVAVLPGQHGGRPLRSVAFDPFGVHLVSAGEDRGVVVWRVLDRVPVRRIGGLHAGSINRAVFSPDGQSIATASDDGTAALWNQARPTARQELRTRGGAPVASVAFSRDGERIVVGLANGWVTVWPRDLRQPWSFRTRWGGVGGVAGDSSGTRIAVGSEHSMVSVWNPSSLRREWSVENSGRYVQDVEFAPGGTRLATASRDGIGRVWDVATGRIQVRLRGHTDWIYDIAWSADGTLLATASRDGTVRVWDAASGQLFAVLRGGGGAVRSVAFRPGATEIASAHEDGNVRLWRIRTPVHMLQAPLEDRPSTKAAVDSSAQLEKRLAHRLAVRRIPFLRGWSADSVRAITETPDGRWKIATTEDGAWIWTDGRPASRLPVAEKGIPVPHFTPDDEWVVVADPQGGVSIYRCEECVAVRSLAPQAVPARTRPTRPAVGVTPD